MLFSLLLAHTAIFYCKELSPLATYISLDNRDCLLKLIKGDQKSTNS